MSLERRYGVRGHNFDGVFFTEDPIEGGTVIGSVQAASNKQNTTLDALKSNMAAQAKRSGANVIASFKYAQKATVFSFSSTQWNASGVAVQMPPEILESPPSAPSPSPAASAHSGRCPMCMEEIHPEARKCKHCGEIFN